MAFDWSPHYRKALALEAQGFSQSEVAVYFTELTGEPVSRDMVRHALLRAREEVRSLNEMPKPDRIPYLTKYMDYISGARPPEPKNWDLRRAILQKAESKVLVHADLHIPFHNEAKVQESIEKHRDADCYVVNADIMDVYAHSSFDKGQSVPFEFEMDETLRYLEYISEEFKHIELLEANHEDRIRRQIEQNLDPSLQFLARKNILAVLAAPFPNIIVHSDLWFFQLGSALYTHPSKASRVELRVSMDVYRHFIEWEEHYNLDPWDTIVVAHTHAASCGYTAKAKIIEPGCLSESQGYAYSPKIPYSRPQRTGYAVITMNKGVVDWNESREYVWPIDKMKR